MAAYILELKGSGDFTVGPSGRNGKGLGHVCDASDYDEAEALALAYFPLIVGGLPRGDMSIKDLGGGNFSVEVDYKSSTATANDPSAGQNPPGNSHPPTDPNKLLTRDMTFTAGGATRRIFKSITTRYMLAKDGDTAPSFGKLIQVNTKDGKVDGCEVIAPNADFTITKRFASLTMGWFRNMLDLVAHTNKTAWLGMDINEVLFKGADGNYRDGDPMPWTVTGKFGYSRNYVYGVDPETDAMLTLGEGDGAIIVPDLYGWEYLWVYYDKVTTQTVLGGASGVNVMLEFPRWAYVEQVYRSGNLSTLGLDQ